MTHPRQLQQLSSEINAAHNADDNEAMRDLVLSPSFLQVMADVSFQTGLDRPLGSFFTVTPASLMPYQERGVVVSVRDLIVNGKESVRKGQYGRKLLAVACDLDLPVFERGNPYYAAGVANNLGRVNIRSFYPDDIALKSEVKSMVQRSGMIITVADVLADNTHQLLDPDVHDTIAKSISPVVETFREVQFEMSRLVCQKYCPSP